MRRLALVLCLWPLHAAAAPHTVLYRQPTDVRPAFVAGELAGPSTLSPEAAARAFLRTADDLAPVPAALLGAATVRHLGDATIVRFDLEHAGLPIVDAQVIVRLDARGAVRLVAGRPLHAEDAGAPAPSLDARAAQEALATTYAFQRAELVRATTPRLVWTPTAGGGLRLAWELRLPLQPVLAEALLYRVDAHTGALVVARNLVRFADQGKVYLVDPTTDGNQTTTEALTGRAPGTSDPPDALFNSLIKILNCVDQHNTVPVNFSGYNVNVHVCDEIPLVAHDGNGDYLQYDPVATPYTATTNASEDATSCITNPGCDPFAEVNAYWHIMKAYTYFQDFNDPHFVHESVMPLQVNVNYRFPIDASTGNFDLANATNANGKLFAWDNSMFMPPGQLIPGVNRPASVMLFEGSHHDVSYDATVAYHEFTHSVIWSTSNLQVVNFDEQGADGAPQALNEGLADTFSSFISGRSTIAGYAFDFDPSGPRDLKDTHLSCPDLLWGEPHQDGQAMSEALWAIHDALGADSEKPIFAAIAGLSETANFAETTAAVESALADALGAGAKDTAHGIFLEHGVVDCQRVIDYTGPRPILFSLGTGDVGMTPVPGYLQFKYTLAHRAQSLHAQFSWTSSSMSLMGGGTPAYSVYVRKGQPITWTYGVAGVSGAKDYELVLTGANQGASWSGDLAQLLDPGDYYLMIVATGSAGGVLQGVTFSDIPAPQDDAGPPPQDDAGAGDDAGGGSSGGRGCGCRTAAPEASGLLALLGLALLVGLGRGRRRR